LSRRRKVRAPAVEPEIPEEEKAFVEAWRWAQSSDCTCFSCWVLRYKLSRQAPELMKEWEKWKEKR